MAQTSLPTINTAEQMVSALLVWQSKLNPLISTPQPSRSPFNLRATATTGATGVQLGWEVVPGVQGYQVQTSSNGNFTNAPTTTLSGNAIQGYFDTGALSGTRWYRVRSLSGSISQPLSVAGTWTAPIKILVGTTATVYDQVSYTSGTSGWNRPSRASAIGI